MSEEDSHSNHQAQAQLSAMSTQDVSESMQQLHIGDSDDDQPQPVVNSSSPMRIGNPPTFSGALKDVSNFISHVKLVTLMYPQKFPNDLTKVLYMCSYLSGHAFTWCQPFLECVDTPDVHPCMHSFPLFLEEFRTAFGEVNELENAEDKILDLKQGSRPASEHTAEFRRLAMRIGWSSQPLLAIYRKSLNDRVRRELATRDMPTSIWDYANRVIDLDNKMREHDGKRRFVPKYNQQQQSSRTTYTRPLPRTSSSQSSEVTDMDIGAVKAYKPLSNEEKARRRKLGLCLYCGEEGHAAANCPNKKGKEQTQSL